MRKMTKAEREALIRDFGWATLCMVDPEERPYAIEFSYFLDKNDICGLVHPTGLTARCLKLNPEVCLKICDSDRQCSSYRAISCFGRASFKETRDPDSINAAWDALERQLGLPSGALEKYRAHYANGKKSLSILRIRVKKSTGVTNWPAGQG